MNSINLAEESRMERKKRELRQKIVSIAANLFAEQGFANTTMEQIAEAADVARKTLYNYFPVKEAIADAYLREISAGLARENLETIKKLPDTESRMLAALNNTYGWLEKNPELAGVVLRYRMQTSAPDASSTPEKTGTQSTIYAILLQGQEAGEIRADLPVDLMVRYIDLLRGTATFEWLKDTSKHQIHDEMEKVVDLVLYGVSSRGR